jgi:hypothetical protein
VREGKHPRPDRHSQVTVPAANNIRILPTNDRDRPLGSTDRITGQVGHARTSGRCKARCVLRSGQAIELGSFARHTPKSGSRCGLFQSQRGFVGAFGGADPPGGFCWALRQGQPVQARTAGRRPFPPKFRSCDPGVVMIYLVG